MGREFELKYRATPQVHAALKSRFAGFRQIRMQTTYFDTPDSALSARKITLRLRRENEETICTLKTPLPDGSRGEWECPAADLADGLAQLRDLGAPDAILQLCQMDLQPLCGAEFVRLAAELPTADGTAELALDAGILLGGQRKCDLCEVELELKTGSDAALLALADQIAQEYDLISEPRSKFRRAAALAKGE